MAECVFSDLPVAGDPEDINKVVTALNELKVAVNDIDITQLNASILIPYANLTLTGLVRNADIKSDAAIAQSKLATLAITDTNIANNVIDTDKIKVQSTYEDDYGAATTLTQDTWTSTGATFSANETGYYVIVASMYISATGYSAGSDHLILGRLYNSTQARVEGTQHRFAGDTSSGDNIFPFSLHTIVQLTAGDVIVVQGYSNFALQTVPVNESRIQAIRVPG